MSKFSISDSPPVSPATPTATESLATLSDDLSDTWPFQSQNKPSKRISFFHQLITVKNIDLARSDTSNDGYKKQLTALDLTLIGIGGIIGAGIFVITGRAAREYAGPGLIISFIIAGLVSTLSSLCYAEMAALVPISGSAYTYAYATLGELVAWIMGWDLLLEYLVGAATVAVGWSGYFSEFVSTITNGRLTIDPRWSNAPFVWYEAGEANRTSAGFYRNVANCGWGPCETFMNLPAFILTLSITFILSNGIKTTSTVNNFFVAIKLFIILLFIGIGISYINPENYHPFIPENQGWGKYGWSGIFQAATTVFFAYIGFDAVSTTAQEAKNPQRDLPIGILASLGICTGLYLAVTAVLTGVQKYTDINVNSPVASAIPLTWLSIFIEIGALSGLISVIMVSLLGQTRIFTAMATDGLLPDMFGQIDPKIGVPFYATITTGTLCAMFAAFVPIDILGNMTSVGTLFAFAVVCGSVPILRYTRPLAVRKFQVPGGDIIGGYVIPLLGVGCSLVLISVGTVAAIYRLFIWMGIGLLLYFSYGYRHSRAAQMGNGQLAFSKSYRDGMIPLEDM